MRPVVRNLWRVYAGADDNYGPTRQFLISLAGAYCAYCEVPLGVSMPIEHKLPKSKYSAFTTMFFNLNLACTACNTFKGARPDVADANQVKAKISAGHTISSDVKNGLITSLPEIGYWIPYLYMVWPDFTTLTDRRTLDKAVITIQSFEPPKAVTDFVGFPDDT